jgi:hypothetical protein
MARAAMVLLAVSVVFARCIALSRKPMTALSRRTAQAAPIDYIAVAPTGRQAAWAT